MKLNKYLIIFAIALSSISLIGCSKNDDKAKKEELKKTFNMNEEEAEEFIELAKEFEGEEENTKKENTTTISIDNAETADTAETEDITEIPDKQLTREQRKEKYIKLLTGSWKSQKDGTLEFLEDGTFTYLSSKNKNYDGKWEVNTIASPHISIYVSVKSALAASDTVVDSEHKEYISSGKLFSITTDEQESTILTLASKSGTLEGDTFIKME